MTIVNQKVLKEVETAYADCWMPWNNGLKMRNLSFKASEPVSVSDAVAIMRKVAPHGYNQFHSGLINRLSPDSKVTIAREGSVCLYVQTNDMPSLKELDADELNLYGSEYRVWWD